MELDRRIRGVRRRARRVRCRGRLLRVRAGQTEHRPRVPVGRQAHDRVPDHHVADCQVRRTALEACYHT